MARSRRRKPRTGLFLALVALHIGLTFCSFLGLFAFYKGRYGQPWDPGVWRQYVLLKAPQAPLLLLGLVQDSPLEVAVLAVPLNSVVAVGLIWWTVKGLHRAFHRRDQ